MFSGSTVTAIFYSLDQLPVRALIIAQSRLCRSELAREKPEGAVLIQITRILVDVFREQAPTKALVIAKKLERHDHWSIAGNRQVARLSIEKTVCAPGGERRPE